MKIRERIDYFLAKIAGEEVDLNDINPPVPVTTTEKLLDKIAESGGSGGMVVTFSAEIVDEEMVITADKSLEEILATIKDGVICEGRIISPDGVNLVSRLICYADYEEQEQVYVKFKAEIDDGTIIILTYSEAGIDIVEKAEAPSGGSGGGALVVNAVYDEDTGVTTLDKTWKEIHDAAPAVWLLSEQGYLPLIYAGVVDAETGVYGCDYNNYIGNPVEPIWSFIANSEDGYPTDEEPSDNPGDEPGIVF